MPKIKEKEDWLHIMVDVLIFRKGKSTTTVTTIAELIIQENSAMELEDYQKGQQKIPLRFYFILVLVSILKFNIK